MGRQKKDVVSINLTIPRQLRERMTAVTGKNWSAIASEAFEKALLREEATRDVKSTEEAFARLAASEQAGAGECRDAGIDAGRRWAMRVASMRQLRRIARELEGSDGRFGRPWTGADIDAWERFARVAGPDMAPEEFWAGAVLEGDYTRRDFEVLDYIEGFVSGAMKFLSAYDRQGS